MIVSKITTANVAFQGQQWQASLDGTNVLECFFRSAEADTPLHWSGVIALNDVLETSFFIGYAETNTALLDGTGLHNMAQAIGFYKAPDDATVQLLIKRDGTATLLTLGDMVDDSFYSIGLRVAGSGGGIHGQFGNTAFKQTSTGNLPDADEGLAASIALVTTEAVANTLSWIRMFAAQDTGT